MKVMFHCHADTYDFKTFIYKNIKAVIKKFNVAGYNVSNNV